jgi:hypothetical protein
MHGRLEGLRHVSVVDRLKVVGLTCLALTLRGFERGVVLLRRALQR